MLEARIRSSQVRCSRSKEEDQTDASLCFVLGWFVAYSAAQKAIIVAHQGTNTDSFLSILEDASISLKALPEARFPGECKDEQVVSTHRVANFARSVVAGAAAAGVQVHSGFQNTQGYTADRMLAAVKAGVAKYGTTKGEFSSFLLASPLSEY